MSNSVRIPSWIYLILALLLGLNIYQWYNTNKLSKLNDQKESELFEMEKVSAELESDFEAAMSSLEEMRSENQAANELIESQKKELQAQKKKINNLIWKSRELTKAENELANLNASVSGYLAQIDKLKKENTQLASANTTLRKEKEVLSQDLSNEKTISSTLNKEKENLIEEKSNLDQANKVLDTKVDRASAIKLNSLTVEGRQNKGSDSKSQSRTKRLDFLRTCILTETNTIVGSGAQEIFIQIIDPEGVTITRNDGATGGILINKLNGEQLRYTFKGNIEYNNDEHEECFDWQPDHRLAKGLYTIMAYHRDYEIGKGTFKLK